MLYRSTDPTWQLQLLVIWINVDVYCHLQTVSQHQSFKLNSFAEMWVSLTVVCQKINCIYTAPCESQSMVLHKPIIMVTYPPRSSSPQGRHPPRSYLLSSSHVDFSRSPVQVQFPLEWNYRRRSCLPPVPMRWLPVCKGNILYTLDNGNIIYIAPNLD